MRLRDASRLREQSFVIPIVFSRAERGGAGYSTQHETESHHGHFLFHNSMPVCTLLCQYWQSSAIPNALNKSLEVVVTVFTMLRTLRAFIFTVAHRDRFRANGVVFTITPFFAFKQAASRITILPIIMHYASDHLFYTFEGLFRLYYGRTRNLLYEPRQVSLVSVLRGYVFQAASNRRDHARAEIRRRNPRLAAIRHHRLCRSRRAIAGLTRWGCPGERGSARNSNFPGCPLWPAKRRNYRRSCAPARNCRDR